MLVGSLCAAAAGGREGGSGGGGCGGCAAVEIVGVTAVDVGGNDILLDLLLMGGVKVEETEAEVDSFAFFLWRGVGIISVSRVGTSTSSIIMFFRFVGGDNFSIGVEALVVMPFCWGNALEAYFLLADEGFK